MTIDPKEENLDRDDRLMTVAEVANYMRLSRHSVYKLISAGILPSIKIGVTKVKKEWLKDMLENYKNCDLTNVEDVKDVLYIGK